MSQISKKILLPLLIIVAFSSVFFAGTAHAESSSIFFKPSATAVGVGDEFTVALMLDSGGQIVNTIAGDMTFSDSILRLERVLTANSVVTSWIESPIISGNSVTFSGIMPGGYDSVVNPTDNSRNPGLVLTLVFSARQSGPAVLAFSDSHLYLNDGMGTEARVIALPYTFSVSQRGSGLTESLSDTISPEAFTPIVSSSPDLFDGAYALFFSTTDKGTGVSHYEVSEGNGAWIRTESPYLLKDQTLRIRIRVKATDLAGNYRIETIGSALGFDKTLLLIPLGLIVLLLLFLYIAYAHKMKKHKERYPHV